MVTASRSDQPIDRRLLDAAIEHFGRKGLEGASTRAIAAAAGTTMSSITYHYGGKEGLYVAAVRHIADQIGGRLAPVVLAADGRRAREKGPEAASAAILAIVEHFLDIAIGAESAAWGRLVVREQMDPTAAFDALYDGAIGRLVDRLSTLLVQAGEGCWDLAEARLKALAIVGQALVFRFGRATLLRSAGWTDVDAAGAAAIRHVVLAHTRAILTDRGTGRGTDTGTDRGTGRGTDRGKGARR
jgi:TetR/AcrR family transcriptional regulator, regulator of cefoperazone and chloramphenicol sensitivity